MDGWNRIPWSHGSHLKGEMLYIFPKFLWGKPWLENMEVWFFVLSFFWDVHIDFEMPFFKGTLPKEHLTPFNATPQQQQQQQQQFFSGSCKWSNTHIRGAAISLIQPPPQKVSPIENVTRIESLDPSETPFKGPCWHWAAFELSENKKNFKQPCFHRTKNIPGPQVFPYSTTLEMEGKQFLVKPVAAMSRFHQQIYEVFQHHLGEHSNKHLYRICSPKNLQFYSHES